MFRKTMCGRLLVLSVIVVLLGAVSAGAEEPKVATGAVSSAEPTYTPGSRAVLLTEGFETSVPPAGWTLQATHTGTETWYQSGSAYAGSFSAQVDYDPDYISQDEWLVSSSINMATGTLSFWSMGSIYWCRDTYDNCDLEVWLVVGAIGGGDDILLGIADGDWPDNFAWVQTTFVLDANLPLDASIGFRYVGNDGAQISLDEVLIDGELVPVELQTFTVE